MELSDYDLLGINSNSSFRLVKNAYHDLARIYHPDSTNVMKGLTKEDRITAFKRIQTAYDNIKKKMNVVEIDMPESEMIYEIPIISRTDIFDNKEISEFNKKFNEEFEKNHKEQTKDDPYSIFYNEPDKSTRNLNINGNDNKLIISNSNYKDYKDQYEFGINYVEDHSSTSYTDIRHGDINKNENSPETSRGISNEKIDIDIKLSTLIEERKQIIELNEKEKEYITKQNDYLTEVEKSKSIIQTNRNNLLIK